MLVTSRYIGRLGNNMFQLAAAIGYAKNYGCRWVSERKNDEVPNFFKFFPNLPVGNAPMRQHTAHDPKHFNYRHIPNQGSLRLAGFFQSEKYFKHAEQEVRDVFKLPFIEGYQDYTSLHVRRGDYVQYKESFPPITTHYIQAACDEMRPKKLLIFSDDIHWCKTALPSLNLSCKIEYSEGRNEFEDMALMHSCGSHIISNSTFSWWAAWLSDNPLVISPSHRTWFGRKNGVTMAIGTPKDIIPDRWKQIDL